MPRTTRGLPADYAADYPRTTRGLCRGLCRRLPADTDYAADCAAHFAGAPPKPKAKQNSQNTLAATIAVPGPSLLPVLMKKDWCKPNSYKVVVRPPLLKCQGRPIRQSVPSSRPEQLATVLLATSVSRHDPMSPYANSEKQFSKGIH